MDCPILFEKEYNKTIAVSVFNPSLQTLHHIKFPVPDGHFEVQVFNESTKKFINTDANVLCQSEESA